MADKTISFDSRYDRWTVHAFDVYPRHSVLAGQTRKRYLACYASEAEAVAAHPDADMGHRSAHNTFGHLPGEDDPVAGGMYPDDWDDGY